MSAAEIPNRPSDHAIAPEDAPRRTFKIASLPEPAKDNPTGRTASQVVTAAYRFADDIRRNAPKD